MDYEHGQNETKTYGLHANAYLVLQPIKNLKFRSSFGIRYLQNNYRKFAPIYNLSSDNFRNENEVVSEYVIYKIITENLLLYIIFQVITLGMRMKYGNR